MLVVLCGIGPKSLFELSAKFMCVCVRVSKCTLVYVRAFSSVRDSNTNYAYSDVLRPQITMNVLILCAYMSHSGLGPYIENAMREI